MTPHSKKKAPRLKIFIDFAAFKQAFRRSLRSTGPLDFNKWQKCVRLGKDNRFCGVWDIPLAGDGDWVLCTDKLVWEASESPSTPVPPGGDGIRLSVGEASADGPASDSDTTSGFTALSCLWRGDSLSSWYHIGTYETAFTARVARYIRVFGGQGQSRHVELECRTFVIPTVAKKLDDKPVSRQFFTTARICSELKTLDHDYRPIRDDDNWKQAFLLQFHQACLRLFADFLANLVLQDRSGRANIDPSWAELRLWNLKEITRHSYECRSLMEMGRGLATTTESMIEVVKASSTVSGSTQAMAKFMPIETEVRGCCREVRERLQELSDELEHDLKFLELARSVNQTQSVQHLTVLATIFLPLSLAAGVLGMQTRFKDLGHLIYDFFGVVVLLGAAVLIIFLIMAATVIIREGESRLTQYSFYRRYVRFIVLFLVASCLLLYGCLVLSSFLVGMFKDVPLGAQILGFGSAVALSLLFGPPAFFIVTLAVVLIPSLFLEPKKRAGVEDPEATSAEDTQQGVMAIPGPETLEDIARV